MIEILFSLNSLILIFSRECTILALFNEDNRLFQLSYMNFSDSILFTVFFSIFVFSIL
jgi:hypothetical protein